MKHKEIQELFLDYCEGLLAHDERLEVQQHLSGCHQCSEAFKDYQRIALLSSLENQSAEPIHPSLAVKVMEFTEEHAQLALGFQPRRILAYLGASAFASLLVLAVLIGNHYQQRNELVGTAPATVASIPATPLQPTANSAESPIVPVTSDAETKALSLNALPPGFRAITINVDKRTGVDGWAKPNSEADVLWTYKEKDGAVKVATILRYAKILSSSAVSTIADTAGRLNAAATETAVTLLANERDTKKLELARSLGTLTLSLSNGTAPAVSADSTADFVTVESILGANNSVADAPVSGRMYTTDSRTGRKTLMVLKNGHWKAEKIDPDAKSTEK